MQAIDMLSRIDFSDGQRKCGLKMCVTWKVEFKDACQRARKTFEACLLAGLAL
jgi:hypothetical protein